MWYSMLAMFTKSDKIQANLREKNIQRHSFKTLK